jgi:glycosyltransferase involved in cell wall biosynthesis
VTSPVDVVIPTCDRPERLAALLVDLRGQRLPPAEIVVVDGSSTQVDWRTRFPDLPVRVIRPVGRTFISKAKNLGWTAGGSEFVAFIDDDNRPPPDLLEVLSQDLAAHPRWGAVVPGVVYRRRPDLVWVYATPFRPDRWGFTLVGRNAPRDPTLERRTLPTDALPNLSMVRRSTLTEVGGFDEQLPVNSSADLCQRIKRGGWEVWADTGVLTAHDVEPPGVLGYWAEHSLEDLGRARYEVADWLRFHRRWNGRGRFFGVRASYHALGFLVPKILAATVRRGGRPLSQLAAALSGFQEGISGVLAADPVVTSYDGRAETSRVG